MCKNTRESKENKGAAFGRAPQGRGAPLWMLSLLNLIILSLNTPVLCLSIRILWLFGSILQIIALIHYLPLFRGSL